MPPWYCTVCFWGRTSSTALRWRMINTSAVGGRFATVGSAAAVNPRWRNHGVCCSTRCESESKRTSLEQGALTCPWRIDKVMWRWESGTTLDNASATGKRSRLKTILGSPSCTICEPSDLSSLEPSQVRDRPSHSGWSCAGKPLPKLSAPLNPFDPQVLQQLARRGRK